MISPARSRRTSLRLIQQSARKDDSEELDFRFTAFYEGRYAPVNLSYGKDSPLGDVLTDARLLSCLLALRD
jgi:hypothetical protein